MRRDDKQSPFPSVRNTREKGRERERWARKKCEKGKQKVKAFSLRENRRKETGVNEEVCQRTKELMLLRGVIPMFN